MIQDRLNDAAIALYRVLSHKNIPFGIFGGYAIGAFCGVRESKDIDCLASVSKAQIIAVLDNKEGFRVIPQTREDYVAFFWSEKANRGNAVLVEIFCDQFPGAQYAMGTVPITGIAIRGSALGHGVSHFLEPFYLFKGKLRAAATRSKFHDAADLRTLVSRHGDAITSRRNELNLEYVGLAMKRYVELERLFEQLGVDVQKAKDAVKGLELNNLPPSAPGDVQRGLLA